MRVKKFPDPGKTHIYKAPFIFVGLFYTSLFAWTVISVLYMGAKGWVNWLQLFMVAFVFVMTWYFSMGISYRVEIGDDGELEFISLRRRWMVPSSKIAFVEGPRLPLGFIRFRLEREKAYLFGVPQNRDFQQILSVLKRTNPDIQFKLLSLPP